jgi:hypothetical protein
LVIVVLRHEPQVARQEIPQPQAGAVQARLHRTRRDAELGGRLLGAQLGDVAQRDHHPQRLGQRGDRLRQLDAQLAVQGGTPGVDAP